MTNRPLHFSLTPSRDSFAHELRILEQREPGGPTAAAKPWMFKRHEQGEEIPVAAPLEPDDLQRLADELARIGYRGRAPIEKGADVRPGQIGEPIGPSDEILATLCRTIDQQAETINRLIHESETDG